MRVYLIRHGAAEYASSTHRDADRALNPSGVAQAAWLGERLQKLEGDDRPKRLLASSAVRAATTARAIGDTIGMDVEFESRLLVDQPVGPVIDLFTECASAGDAAICVIGHNPQLSGLVGKITGGATGLAASVRTGEAVVLNFNADQPLGGGQELARWRLGDPVGDQLRAHG